LAPDKKSGAQGAHLCAFCVFGQLERGDGDGEAATTAALEDSLGPREIGVGLVVGVTSSSAAIAAEGAEAIFLLAVALEGGEWEFLVAALTEFG
jgi:hypothetical protein